MMEPAVLVGTGGAIGAILRFAVGVWLSHERFPFATVVVNVIGSFLLGGVVAVAGGRDVVLFLGVGLCGSFTTYSSFSVETVRLWEGNERFRAGVYAVGTLLVCLLAAGLGGWLGGFVGP